ncbi:hypothetical protein TGMAS_412760 [Toxoplasma gondii MAS]|uniref:Uncharacterized protein n=1 Tax=Toxoplasma gondii MAS TaxID=943118 RepID=A0A086QZ91_TOXGO|nr:hypothetical protein TGMAS_412760 [Toxoplasma gondii MAS]
MRNTKTCRETALCGDLSTPRRYTERRCYFIPREKPAEILVSSQVPLRQFCSASSSGLETPEAREPRAETKRKRDPGKTGTKTREKKQLRCAASASPPEKRRREVPPSVRFGLYSEKTRRRDVQETGEERPRTRERRARRTRETKRRKVERRETREERLNQ